MFGARWVDDAGRSAIATDPAWTRMLTWQKALVDWYGHADLVAFEDSVGREFTPDQRVPRRAGSRCASTASGGSRSSPREAPDLAYAARRCRSTTSLTGHYGSGYINGSVIGIPARAGHAGRELEAREVPGDRRQRRWSSSRTACATSPRRRAPLRSPDLIPDEHFAVFLDIFGHPMSSATPVTAAGTEYEGVLTAFAMRWQAGEVDDLQAGLREVDREIDTLLRRATAGIRRLDMPAA